MANGCESDTVTAKQTELTTAEAALATLVAAAVPMQAAVDTAMTDKKTAVDAVIAKDADIKTLLATDDTEQQSEMTL